jgi:hypothetical protein
MNTSATTGAVSSETVGADGSTEDASRGAAGPRDRALAMVFVMRPRGEDALLDRSGGATSWA